MSLLTATNLGKSFGSNDIFQDISLRIAKRSRIAIVGSNGIGKTTLLKLLIGLDEPSQGKIHKSKGLKIGYLPQETTSINASTLWELCISAFSTIITSAKELKTLENEMMAPEVSEEVINRYGSLQSSFEDMGGYIYENIIQQTLTGLGFVKNDYHRPINQLSGGQRTRAALAKLLLDNPDILLLDEPTNHLDISAVEWLEAFLKDWEGAVVIVSHDRYFLDEVARTIWEMTPAIEEYRGNYSSYLMQREERYTRRLEEYETQTEFIEKEEDFIRRNIAGQKTSQASGRLKRLARLLEESRLIHPTQGSRNMRMRLEPSNRSGNIILRTVDLKVGYYDEGQPLFDCPDLLLERLECVAIIGPNGAGKTTFLRTVLGLIPPYSGETILGASLKIGYFAQAHEDLISNNTLVEEINRVRPNMLPSEVRNYLAKFLFTGDDVFRRVDTLSGGERGRLALGKLALTDANLLLLDEPTNHLDLQTQEVLQNILSEYHGTIILVSHDRYLINALATQIWEVSTEYRTLNVYAGNYSQYILEKSKNHFDDFSSPILGKPPQKNSSADAQKLKTISRNKEQQLKKQLDVIEKEVQLLELELTRLGNLLENPTSNPDMIQEWGIQYVNQQTKLDKYIRDWEKIMSSFSD